MTGQVQNWASVKAAARDAGHGWVVDETADRIDWPAVRQALGE